MKRILLLLMVISMLLPLSMISAGATSAAEDPIPFEWQDVKSDLTGATIGGKTFSVQDYPYVQGVLDPDGEPKMQLLSFFEYGYSRDLESETLAGEYGLYLYVYNPGNVAVSKRNRGCNVTIAFGNGDYHRYGMSLLSSGGTDTAQQLYLKFKVDLTADELRALVGDDESRVYHVSEFRIGNVGAYATGDTGTSSNTYVYTGRMKNFGADTDTLQCQSTAQDVLCLDLHSTYYRPEGPRVQNTSYYSQLNTVYFSVPNEYLETYGELFKVHFDSYVYETKPMYLIADKECYTELYKHLGEDTGEPVNKDFGWKVYPFVTSGPEYEEFVDFDSSETLENLILGVFDPDGVYHFYYPFNDDYMWFYIGATDLGEFHDLQTTMYWLFDISGVTDSPVLSGEDLEEYAKSYIASGHDVPEEYELILDKYPSFLFETSAPIGFEKPGYNEFNATKGDTFTLDDHHTKLSDWWNTVWHGASYENTPIEDIEMILPVRSSDLSEKSAEAFCKEFLIAEEDYGELAAFIEAEESKDCTVYLIRHSVTDYRAYSAFTDEVGTPAMLELKEGSAVTKQTVFFDLGVIDLTFRSEEFQTFIPVVSSPVDVWNDVNRAPEQEVGGVEPVNAIISALVSIVVIVLICIVAFIGIFALSMILIGVGALLLWLFGQFPFLLDIIRGIINGIGNFFKGVFGGIKNLFKKDDT